MFTVSFEEIEGEPPRGEGTCDNRITLREASERALKLSRDTDERLAEERRSEAATPAICDGHVCAITTGDEITVEYIRPGTGSRISSRLGFVWGEDPSWFTVTPDGQSASGYLDHRLDMDALRNALMAFKSDAEQIEAAPAGELRQDDCPECAPGAEDCIFNDFTSDELALTDEAEVPEWLARANKRVVVCQSQIDGWTQAIAALTDRMIELETQLAEAKRQADNAETLLHGANERLEVAARSCLGMHAQLAEAQEASKNATISARAFASNRNDEWLRAEKAEARLAEAHGVIDANLWPDTTAKLLREAESRAEKAETQLASARETRDLLAETNEELGGQLLAAEAQLAEAQRDNELLKKSLDRWAPTSERERFIEELRNEADDLQIKLAEANAKLRSAQDAKRITEGLQLATAAELDEAQARADGFKKTYEDALVGNRAILERETRLRMALEECAKVENWDLPDFVWVGDESPIKIAQSALNPPGEGYAPRICAECGKYQADTPSKICVGCAAHKEHTAI